jgi:two-component system, NtrC family, response regulator GlrR
MIGESRAFREMVAILERIAQYDAAVLIQGETGTGKELAARAIHYQGPRRACPFIPVNCGALPDTLVENELFGHRRGAYTSAHSDEAGLVDAANDGTLFLDEVDSLSPKGQVTLLRFLEDRQYRPVGGRDHRRANVRIIAASNTELEALVSGDRFRPDLLYRLQVFRLRVPPLRDRDDDVLLLAGHFIRESGARYGKPELPLAPATRDWFRTYRWPGNIRELENVVCEAFLLSEDPVVAVQPPARVRGQDDRSDVGSYRLAKQRAVAEFERRFLLQVIDRTRGNVSEAARMMGTERRYLGRLLKKYNIARPRQSA